MQRTPFVMDKEPELPEVLDEDKPIVRNVIYVVTALNKHEPFCSQWRVTCEENQGYTVHVTMLPTWSLSVNDLQVIREINPMRVSNVVVACMPTPATQATLTNSAVEQGSPCFIKVVISDRNQRVVQTDVDVVRIRKRSRHSSFFG